MQCWKSLMLIAAGLAGLCGLAKVAHGDVFVYQNQVGERTEVEARLVTSARGQMVLELADGEYRIIPEGTIEKRDVKVGPTPLTADEIAGRLKQRFGDDLFRSYVKEPFVMGLVLASPLPKNSDARAKNFLQRAHTFMKNVENAFVGFVKDARIPARPPTHPLVVLIFETDTVFNSYTERTISGGGLSTARIAGFYYGLTNYLAIRLGECRTFDVPLHEAIHQQVYNRNVLQRLAPVPHWFDEGIATGFEANQGKVSIGPTKISPRYARQVIAARELTFEKILADDNGFSGDVLAGEAYGNAWGLHWLLVTKYRAQYAKYIRLLAEKEPLVKDDSAQRLADFREAFGKEPRDIEKEFRPFLDSGIKKQKVVLNPEKPAGISLTHENLGEVEMNAVTHVDEGGRMEVRGKLTNNSPFRAMAFHVTVETDSGTYADWYVPSLDVQKSTSLDAQNVRKLMRGGRGGAGRTFRVRVRSTPPDSQQAFDWKDGKLPVPEFTGE